MRVLSIFAFLVVASCVASAVAEESQEVLLWPNGMPEPVVPAEPSEIVERKDGISRRTNVSNPRLFVFQPPMGVLKTGTGAIVVPGC